MLPKAARLVSRFSATALIWIGATLLGGADLISAGAIPGTDAIRFPLALGLAIASGVVFCLAVARGILARSGSGQPATGRSRFGGGRVAGWSDDAIKHEAEWGVRQFELYLSRQAGGQNAGGSGHPGPNGESTDGGTN